MLANREFIPLLNRFLISLSLLRTLTHIVLLLCLKFVASRFCGIGNLEILVQYFHGILFSFSNIMVDIEKGIPEGDTDKYQESYTNFGHKWFYQCSFKIDT